MGRSWRGFPCPANNSNPSPLPDIPRVGWGGSQAGLGRQRPPRRARADVSCSPGSVARPRAARRGRADAAPAEDRDGRGGFRLPGAPPALGVRAEGCSAAVHPGGRCDGCNILLPVRPAPRAAAAARVTWGKLKRKARVADCHLLRGARGPPGDSVRPCGGAEGRGTTGKRTGSRQSPAQTDTQMAKKKKKKIRMRWRKIVQEDLVGEE